VVVKNINCIFTPFDVAAVFKFGSKVLNPALFSQRLGDSLFFVTFIAVFAFAVFAVAVFAFAVFAVATNHVT